jgi:hypothetical protein
MMQLCWVTGVPSSLLVLGQICVGTVSGSVEDQCLERCSMNVEYNYCI